MRLHRLSLSAFGPYPGAETVDFDALGIDGLFLLHGDTGAGKTTVLDGVAFALFGTVPGARGETRRLRCDYAATDTHTEVTLELTVQGTRLRITRSPEYRRPKRRGGGETTEHAKVSLVWCDAAPNGAPPEGLTRADEVGRTVQRLLGMSAAQFFQVVLLPQGEFAKFLRSDTAQREELLEKLFGTQRFADIERWFRDRRVEVHRGLDQERRSIDALLARVGQAAGVEPPTGVSHPEAVRWLEECRERAAAGSREAAAADDRARQAAAVAEQDVDRRRTHADRIRRIREARADLKVFEQQQEERDSWAEEIARARRAVPVLAAEASRAKAAQEHDDAVNDEAEAQADLAELDATQDFSVTRPVADLRQHSAELRGVAGGLRELATEAEDQQADLRRLAALMSTGDDLGARREAVVARLAEAPAALEQARTDLQTARDATARVEAAAARVDELDRLVADAEALPPADRTLVEAEDRLRRATDTHQHSRDQLLDLRQRRLDGMAAELAGGLEDGQPCAVCGAREHPAPAAATDPVTESDEQAAVAAEQSALQTRTAAEKSVSDAAAHCDALRTRLNNRHLDDLAAERDEAAALHRSLLAEASTAATRTARLAELEAGTEDLRAQAADLDRKLAAADVERAELTTRTSLRADRLDEARGSHPDVPTRLRHLITVADAVDRLADRRGDRVAAAARLADLQAEADRLAVEAGFPSASDASQAARPESTLDEINARLTAAEHRAATARAVLAEPDLAVMTAEAIATDVEADLAAADQLLAESRTRAEHALVAAKAAEARAAAVDALAARLTAAWAKLAPREADFEQLNALTDVVNGRGQNSKRMSLRSYVLAARLEEVANAATGRLRRMSQGRYTFVHTDAAGARGTRGGLGLDVRDDYSGQVRPSKTLSGGESFLASLSLALGLADVVAAETGGALLDTLFVDEGFGTLDADTLDLVMDTLDELRAGGRIVGLVSHVEELRQRIPVRLKVRKARTGSTLELTAG